MTRNLRRIAIVVGVLLAVIVAALAAVVVTGYGLDMIDLTAPLVTRRRPDRILPSGVAG